MTVTSQHWRDSIKGLPWIRSREFTLPASDDPYGPRVVTRAGVNKQPCPQEEEEARVASLVSGYFVAPDPSCACK